MSSKFGRRRRDFLLWLSVGSILAGAVPAYAQPAPALPDGGQFVRGEGSIAPDGGAGLRITQSSGRGVIDWRSFSIGGANQVIIDNGAGATLNRVLGGQLSRIDGLLSATGSVYLMNPHGVIVGPEGRVITGGNFVASTRAFDADAFMNGDVLRAVGRSDGDIANYGTILSEHGSVVMIARSVTNAGTITANDGRVTLAAADDVLLATTDGSARDIFVSVAPGTGGDVTQAGRIEAAAVALQAAGGNIFALAGTRDGLVSATGTATIDGQLWLTAPQGRVELSGTLVAAAADGAGGAIGIEGRDLHLAASARVDATGTEGGEILVGTAQFGTGTGLAESLTVDTGATLLAGGPLGGGRIETSGKSVAIGRARVDAGKGGLWLIDPNDITIDAPLAASITASLDGGTDVLQQTTAGGTGGVGDITVAAPIVWTGTGDLTLDAVRDVIVNDVISGAGNLELLAERNVAINSPVSANQVLATALATMTIGAAGSVSGTGDVGLEAATFVNQAGAGAVSSTGNDWFIVSDDAAGSSDGGLVPDYYQYDFVNVSGAPLPGNGRFYRLAPSVTITLGSVTKSYDGTTIAFLDDTNTNVAGLVNNEDWTLDGAYAGKNVGTGILVTADNFQAFDNGIPVFGYATNTPVMSATGTITAAVLSASIIGTPTKTYNTTTAVALAPANFGLAGVAAGESITINAAAMSAYDSADAGARTVNATFSAPNFTAGSGTSLANYVLPTSATGAGLINPATLIINGVTANDKVYDGTTAAMLDTGSASIFGVIGGDNVMLDAGGATGSFADKNVGTAKPVTAAGFMLTGADAANYVAGQPTDLAANITPATLVVSGLIANDKIYDGTTTASLNAAGVQFTGLISGDDVAAGGTGAQVNFASKNAGQDISVTITGLALSGADAGNYNIFYSGALVADILQRPLSFGFSGTPTKVYDGTTNAAPGSAGVSFGNVVSGESITLAQAANVQYTSKNVGVWDITGTLTPADFVAGPNTLLSNYILPTAVSSLGEITPAPLAISIVGNPTKTYDGNTSATLGPDNFAVTGFVFGEGAEVTETSGQYSSPDAGTRTVTVELDAGDFDPDPGTMMSNYFIPSPVYGPGTIIRRDIGPGFVNVDISGNPSKVYDGTIAATLTPADYTLSGFVPGEGATITETMGEYDLKDAGQRAVLVLLDPGDFVPDPGTNLDNYTLPDQATGVGTIFAKALTATIIGNPTKVYNGTVRAVVAPANYSIAGAIAGESVTVAPGVIGNYDDADAGSRTITSTFTAASNFLFSANTLSSNYVLPTMAQGPGTITPAPLVVLGVGAQNKVYDQTTAATLTGDASLFGIVAGDMVLLQGGSATGTFVTPNVGSGIAVTVAGYAIAGPDAGNYELFQPSGLFANITRRGLAVANVSALDKFYDGTTTAMLALGGASLTGVLSGDDVTLDPSGSTAIFFQKNIGTDLRVETGGFSLSGADSGNYSLSQPSGLTADINPVQLSGAIVGNPTKTYDGTNAVSLALANYTISGFIPGEGGTITQSAGSSYDSPNAGARTVTANLVISDIVPDAGTLLSNYLLPAAISGPGTITQAQLLATIINNPTKVYDSNTAATLAATNFALAGFVSGEGATVTEAVGAYDIKNVGSRTVTASLGAGDFTANSGTILANYILPTSASGAGTITPAQVQVIQVMAEDKVYDGTTAATLDSSNANLSGVFAGDTVTVVSTGATGTFATKNVGTDIPVTAIGYTIAGTDAANYTVLQPVGLAADIFEAMLQLASVTKVYNANTVVPTVNNAYTLSGVISGDNVFVSASGITGNYIDKNVGTGKSVTLTGVVLGGADAGNYLIDPGVTNALIGIITPATLNVIGAQALDKTYDQNTVAQLDNSGTMLSGVLGTDVVNLSFATTGNFNNANAGANKPVTTTAYAISGTDAGNYTLVQPQGLTADIFQREIFLALVAKVYDGTTALPTASSGYSFTGVLGGDTVIAQTSGVTGQYNDSKNVGTGKPVTVNNLTLTGASGGNYFIDASITDTIGIITQKQLTAAIVGTPTKTYDALNAAALLPANFQISGFVLSEGATVTETAGTYDSINAGPRTVTAALDAGDFTPDGGTLLSNYILPTSASGAGLINQAVLTISGVTANDKVYDGTTLATLDSSAAMLNGIVAAEPLTITLNSSAATGQFAQADVGTNIPVTASGYALGGDINNNYILTQPTGLMADITQASISVDLIRKIYDGTLALPTASSAYTLDGVVAGDNVFVVTSGITGAYADKNVAANILVSYTGLALGGADAGNYLVSSSTSNNPIGQITPASLTAAIIGTPTKTYNGTTAATLTNANFQLTGFVSGEGATVTQTAGTYTSSAAGNRTVNTTLAAGQFTANGGTLLSNYTLPTTASGPGRINQAPLAIAIVGTPAKTYDGTTLATLVSLNYQLTGFVGTQGATVTETMGTYASANAGPRTISVTLTGSDYTANPGTTLSNYILPTSATGPGQINQALLTAAIIGNPTKTYNANANAFLMSTNYALSGFVSGEGATVSQAAGTYDSPNAGSRTVTADLDADDFTANAGTLLANYVLPTSASGAGTIDPALLTVAIVGNPTRAYDGTTVAALTSTDFQLSGFFLTDGATVTQSVGAYDSANAGPRTVTASLAAGDYTANPGTLLSNYVLPTMASGAGTIEQALLMAAIVGNPTRAYDGTVAATLTSAHFQLTGFVAGEGATVTETAGLYDGPNAGAHTVTAALQSGDFTAGAGTLLANYVLPTSATGAGTIDPRALTAAIVGLPTKTYDATTDATLASTNFELTGFVPGEGATVTETAGTYASSDAGIRAIDAVLDSGDFAADSGTLLSNYLLPASASGFGIINKAQLAAAIIGDPTKTYDGTVAATLNGTNYQLTGFIGSQGATVTQAVGEYASPDAGARIVTAMLGSADFVADAGTDLRNYALPTSASGLGTIDPAQLMAAIVGNPTKTYDGTTAATLDASNFALTGFIGSEGATVTQTAGQYASPNAGARIVTASLAAGDFTADSGTLLSNYILPTSASGLGTIDPAQLMAAIVGNPTKTYDGTTTASLTATDYQITGFIGSDAAEITQTMGSYASADAGQRLVTAMLAAGNFSALGATDLSNYVLPTSASGLGTIDPKALAALIVGNPTKTYDGNTAATLDASNYQITGFIGSDEADVTQTMGTYASVNAGARLVTAMLATGDFSALGATNLSNYVLPMSATGLGTIDPRSLTALIVGNPTRTYDATTAATLDSSNFALTGFVSGEGATVTEMAGTYASPDAGVRVVTATLDGGDFMADAGTLLSNYVLPTGATGTGTIDPRALTAAIVGDPTKTYDGATAATLVSANYELTGFVAGQGATVTRASGQYGSPNAGLRTVTATLAGSDFVADGGTLLANYILPTTASGFGTIDPAQLMAAIVGNPTKTYDGTTAATLMASNFALTGFIGSEGATVTQTAGQYAAPNAGPHIVTATLAAGDFTADSGTLLSNYVLPTSASGLGTIGQKALMAAIVGNPTKTYDATTAATLTMANYQITGFIGSDDAEITEAIGTYASADAGLRLVTAMLAAGDFSAIGATELSNYVLPTSATGLGTIDPKALLAVIVGNPTKTYDGNTAATLDTANYQIAGFIGSDAADITQAAGTYASANAGARLVTAILAAGDFTALGATNLSNYVLPVSATGLGTIDPKALTALIVGNPAKTYDATTAATLASANFAIAGFVSGEGATVTETAGTYASPDAGLRAVTAVLDSGDFTADAGTLLSNYVLPTGATGAGTIDPRALTAAIVGNPTKTYDQTAAATLASTNYALTGFVAGQGATVTQTAGEYGSPNAGLRTVSATLGGSDFVADGGTSLANYVLPTAATGFGTITPREVTLVLFDVPTKVYDGTADAIVMSVNFTAVGFLGSDGLSVESSATGSYADRNVGLHEVRISTSTAEFVPLPGTVLANYELRSEAVGVGRIVPAPVTATLAGVGKTYDGTTAAILAQSNFVLGGFIAGEGATVSETVGTYASPNAGLRIVTAMLEAGDFTATGSTLLSNYDLPAIASGIGTIDPRLLTAAIVGNPVKEYDGNTLVTLGPDNYELTGFVAGESASVSETEGSYARPDSGLHIVTAMLEASDFVAGESTSLSNYLLPTSATGLGTIVPKILVARLGASIINNPTKVYDGNNVATLTPENYGILGFVDGEGVTVTQTVGVYSDIHAGMTLVTASLSRSDFSPNPGTNLFNYILPESANGQGTILQRPLDVAIIGLPARAYDGTVAAALTSANFSLTGFVGGEGVTVNQTAGSYDSADAGSRTVTASLAASDYAATGSTLLADYILPTSASGPGQIDPRALAVSIVGNPTRVYNGTTTATLVAGNYLLTGFVGGEGATVTETLGAYDSKNAGMRTVSATLQGSDYVAGTGTLLSNYILPSSAAGPGQIDRAPLGASIVGNPTKTFDGNADATLTSANYLLTGFVAGEGATVTETSGTYDASNPGQRIVTAMLGTEDFSANAGTLLDNYILPTSATGPGAIIGASPECLPDASGDCIPDSPDIFYQFTRAVGNFHFYIPYPAQVPIYLGRTNAFAGLPIIEPIRIATSEDELAVDAGARNINSTEQILQQGRRGKEWTIRSELPTTVSFEGLQ